MIRIVLIYFLGKPFYDLSIKFEKKKWLFAVLGVVAYYAGTFIGGFIIALGYEFSGNNIDDLDDTLLGFMVLPLGLLAAYLYYQALKRKWEKQLVLTHSDVLDDELLNH